MTKISAIILAAGLSRRMGSENKMLLNVFGKPMIQWVIESVSDALVSEIIVVGSEESWKALEGLLKDSSIQLVNNPEHKSGMTSSIKRGVHAAAKTSDGFMICLGDQPFITTEDYNQIIKSFNESLLHQEKSIAVPFYNNQKGNPVIFSSHFRKSILTHQEPEGCKEIVQTNKDCLVKVMMKNSHILTDIDTPEDYKTINGKL